MLELPTEHWRRLHGPALGNATLKKFEEDFVVTEELGFEPTGSGEHIFLWLQKSNLNTAFVAEEIAKFCKLPLRNITYAGRKDKFALTQQWIGVHIANFKEPDWQTFDLPGAKILHITRNDRKLRTGVLKGNRFKLTLRDVQLDDPTQLTQRLANIQQYGVPNYYGAQRFGQRRSHPDSPNELQMGGNLALAQKLINGETIRNRNKRSVAISALRSWLFNEFIHQRICQQTFATAQDGDVLGLAGSNSFFVDDNADQAINQRLLARDIGLTAPLWGKGNLHSKRQALQFEQALAAEYEQLCEALAELGLKQERRMINLFPEDFQWQYSENVLTLEFALPAGCFATSVVREIVDVDE